MSKVLIVTAHVEGSCEKLLSRLGFDKVICADGGFPIAKRLGLEPDLLIGDWDSAPVPEGKKVIKLPAEKDMTDSEAAVDYAYGEGFDEITVLGGLGGRLDHTLGNIGILSKYCDKPVRLAFADGQNYVFMISPGKTKITKNGYKYLSVISHSDETSGLTLKGVKYPLCNYRLTNSTSLGVSNEITGEYAEITFTAGKLLVILSKDTPRA